METQSPRTLQGQQILFRSGKEYVAIDHPDCERVTVWPSSKHPGYWHLLTVERGLIGMLTTDKPMTPWGMLQVLEAQGMNELPFTEQPATHTDL